MRSPIKGLLRARNTGKTGPVEPEDWDGTDARMHYTIGCVWSCGLGDNRCLCTSYRVQKVGAAPELRACYCCAGYVSSAVTALSSLVTGLGVQAGPESASVVWFSFDT